MHPYPFILPQMQKRSREDPAQSSVGDLSSSFAKSSEPTTADVGGTSMGQRHFDDLLSSFPKPFEGNVPGLGEIPLDFYDERIHSVQNKRSKSTNSSHALTTGLDDSLFATPTKKSSAVQQAPPVATTCPSPDDLFAFDTQMNSPLIAMPLNETERNMDKGMSTSTNDEISIEELPFHTIVSALWDKDGNKEDSSKRFKPFHEEKWNEHLKRLRAFKTKFGHCLVPHTFPDNPHLARWVKRQRRQYKLMLAGGKSTMTQERVDLLNEEGFIWDSHDIVWRERYNQLVEYKAKYGHTRVPTCCQVYPHLASWVKCQRRQYKLFFEGKRSSMSAERTHLLESIGFTWEVRKVKSSSDKVAQALSDPN